MSNPVNLLNRMNNVIAKCFVCGEMIREPEIRVVSALNGVQIHPANQRELILPMSGVPVHDKCFKDLGLDDSEPSNIFVTQGGLKRG